MKHPSLVLLSTVLLSSLVACTGVTPPVQSPTTSTKAQSILSPEQALDYFNLADLGITATNAKGQIRMTSAAQVAQNLGLSAQAVQSQPGERVDAFLEVGNFYVTPNVYESLQQASTPYALSIEAMNALEGNELNFIFTAPTQEMRKTLNTLGLQVRDIRTLSQDGNLSLSDLGTLADQTDKTPQGKAWALTSGRTVRQTLEQRIERRNALKGVK